MLSVKTCVFAEEVYMDTFRDGRKAEENGNDIFDVLIIGGGVVGSAAARELSRYQLKIGVLEKEPDVVCGTSGRNSGVLHAGFNNKPGSKMAAFCVAGNRGFDRLAAELDIPYRRTGKLVVGFTEEDRAKLQGMLEQGRKNNVPGLEIVDADFIRSKAPHVKGNFALWSGSTAVLDPFLYTIALAENALHNGVQYFLRHEVTEIRRDGSGYAVTCCMPAGAAGADPAAGSIRKTFRTRWVVNCAGLYSDKISAMLGIDEYTIHPCRGEYYILDKNAGSLLPVPAYPVPDPKSGGLGIHLTPTVDGNIMIGPSNEYLDNPDDVSNTAPVMEMLLSDGARIFPYLKREYFIRNFSGVRPKLTSKEQGGYHDFVIERRDDIAPHAVNLVGIESPGLTSAIPIAREIIRLITEVEELKDNPAFDPFRKGIVPFAKQTPERQAELIRQDPDYGEVVCRCETVTKAEILQAIRNPLGVHTLAGIKYRCRASMGRCQGGYCTPRLMELICEETGCSPEDIRYSRDGSWMVTGQVRA